MSYVDRLFCTTENLLTGLFKPFDMFFITTTDNNLKITWPYVFGPVVAKLLMIVSASSLFSSFEIESLNSPLPLLLFKGAE